MRRLAYILSLILIFTIPWEDAFTFTGFGTITRIIGLSTFGVWLAAVTITGKFRKLQVIHWLVFLFILWNVASIFWTHSYEETTQQIKTYVQLAILTWIIWDLYKTFPALNAALQTFILGAYIAVFSTVYNYLRGREIKLYSGGRYAGVGNAVDLALVLAIGLPIAWHLVSSSDVRLNNRLLRLIYLVYIPAASFAIVLTGTRTAIFAVLPAFAYILWTSNRLKPAIQFLMFIALICSVFVLQSYIPQSAIERLGTTSSSIATGDLGGRVKLWREALSIFLDHPYWGIGSGALSSKHELGAVAHNTFLSVLAELGLIGFLLFMSILAIIAYQISQQNKHYAQLWFTIWSIWTIGVFTLTWEYRKATWLILTLTVVSASLIEARKVVRNRTASLSDSKVMSFPPN